ncbi:MAG: hypothetical protein HYX76_15325, partial [Acidobacteria bacterium]|nr:hypothetical protein [Acidobacteriota bacterium]
MAVRNRGLAALVLFGVLAAIHTWPLALHPATLSRNDNADTMLNEWTIAWVAHALPRDPAHLFDANIFHPERRTLAFSEHLLLPALMVAPVSWLGGSPVLAFNLALLAGLVLTGWLTALVVSRWTDNWGAGVLAGSLFAFNAHTLTRLPHLQAMHLEFLPMAVAALDRVLALGRPRDALATAAWFLMQALCSVYSTVFTAVAFSAALVARLGDWIGRRSRAGRAMGLALGLAAIFSVPILLPYYRVSREQHVVRSLDEAAHYSATWRDYLATAGTLHFNTWSHRFVVYDATALFPGVVALVLAGGALVTGVAVRDRRARVCLAIAFVGFILSFGPQTPVYTLAYHAFPLMRAVRAASRFAVLVLFGIAALAGFGLASLLPPIERRSTRGHTLARAVVAAAI